MCQHNKQFDEWWAKQVDNGGEYHICRRIAWRAMQWSRQHLEPVRRTPIPEKRPANVTQHSNGAEPAEICLCDDCVVESCDMRGEAVECSGRVTENGKLRHC
jgi:hypothetical protein